MKHMQNVKWVVPILPQAIVDDAYFSGSHQHGSVNTSINCSGFGRLDLVMAYGASDIAVAEMSLYESDDNTTFTIVTDSNYSGSLPSATDDGKLYAWSVDLRKRKKYIRVNLKAGNGSTGTYAAVVGCLSEAGETPNTTTERGLGSALVIL